MRGEVTKCVLENSARLNLCSLSETSAHIEEIYYADFATLAAPFHRALILVVVRLADRFPQLSSKVG